METAFYLNIYILYIIKVLMVSDHLLFPGEYINGVCEIGMFEHSLTTDLLNHLVFVQKVFMRVSMFSKGFREDDGV